MFNNGPQGYDLPVAVTLLTFSHLCVITGTCNKSNATGPTSGPCISFSSGTHGFTARFSVGYVLLNFFVDYCVPCFL